MEHQLLKRRTFLGGDVAVGKKAYKRTEQIAFSAKQRKKHNEEHNQVKANTFQRLEEKKVCRRCIRYIYCFYCLY